MGFWKALFGGEEASPEEEKKNNNERQFDLLKYDGVKAMRMGQAEYAVKCFRAALELHEDLEIRDYLSQALTRQGALDEALTELKTIARAAPDNINVLLQAAYVAYLNEDYAEMTSCCEQVLAIDADNARAHYLRALACKGSGDIVGTIAWLTKTIALDEKMGDAHLLRGQTLLAMGDTVSASEDVAWLLQHSEAQEDILLLAARVAHAQGKDDEAIKLYDQVNDVNPFQVDAYRERGRIRFEQGDKQEAEEDMQKVLELNPDELSDVNGDYEAEGIEQIVRRAYSNMNPFGL